MPGSTLTKGGIVLIVESENLNEVRVGSEARFPVAPGNKHSGSVNLCQSDCVVSLLIAFHFIFAS